MAVYFFFFFFRREGESLLNTELAYTVSLGNCFSHESPIFAAITGVHCAHSSFMQMPGSQVWSLCLHSKKALPAEALPNLNTLCFKVARKGLTERYITKERQILR